MRSLKAIETHASNFVAKSRTAKWGKNTEYVNAKLEELRAEWIATNEAIKASTDKLPIQRTSDNTPILTRNNRPNRAFYASIKSHG